MPSASSASLSPISWVAIDLTLTSSSAPVARARSATMRQASPASRAQCTIAPAAVAFSSNWTSSSGSRRRTSALIARPASRSCSQSSSSPTTRSRLSRMVWVAWRRLRAQLGLGQLTVGGRRERRVHDAVCQNARQIRAPLRSALMPLGPPRSATPGCPARCATGRRRCGSGTSCRRPPRDSRAGAGGCWRICPRASPSRRRCSSARTCRRSRSTPSAPASSTSSMPRTARSSRSGLSPRLQHPQPVAGRVVGHLVREARAGVGHPEHVDEQLGQLVGPGDRRRRCRGRGGGTGRGPSPRTSRSGRRRVVAVEDATYCSAIGMACSA